MVFDRWRNSWIQFRGSVSDRGTRPALAGLLTRSAPHGNAEQPLASPSGQPPPQQPVPIPGHMHGKVFFNCSLEDLMRLYRVEGIIGVGGFAVVKKAVDLSTGEPVAIKIVDTEKYQIGDQSLEREIDVLCKVDHPNCIKLHAVYHTGRNVYIVTELVYGGELLDRITETGNYSEKVAAKLLQQILLGVRYLHSRGIVHRDLKLENLVLVNRRHDSPVKIADFGLSKILDPQTLLKTICGSPQYVAPEVLAVGESAYDYTPAVDMWSVGVILFILLSGYSPFDDDNDQILFEKIKQGVYDTDDPVWDDVSDLGKDLVAKLLTVDASCRLSAVEALGHPWIQYALSGQAEGPPPLGASFSWPSMPPQYQR
mmetsp:Transcript_38638/g.109276  ORF Transcript_38638/g.109276 Transcript_38638/m.109276 type:complete len:369 (-) Transcript_38638:409-1515(-)